MALVGDRMRDNAHSLHERKVKISEDHRADGVDPMELTDFPANWGQIRYSLHITWFESGTRFAECSTDDHMVIKPGTIF